MKQLDREIPAPLAAHEVSTAKATRPLPALTHHQQLRLRAIADEYATLFNQNQAAEALHQAIAEMLAAFVTGGMELELALDTLSVAMSVTHAKLFGGEPTQ
ncbi:MAG: hypothetical protein FIA97_10215 [Methylococcaceae bacterium]|nr:hypothetical protein [Methylococcaceae bacterium]